MKSHANAACVKSHHSPYRNKNSIVVYMTKLFLMMVFMRTFLKAYI